MKTKTYIECLLKKYQIQTNTNDVIISFDYNSIYSMRIIKEQ